MPLPIFIAKASILNLFPPSTALLHAESFGAAVEALDIRPDNFVLIATNNQDREALDKLIEQPIAWLGLLASRRKGSCFSCVNCVRKAWLKNILPVYMRPLVTT